MLRLKATKKRLYDLVAAYEALPMMKQTDFVKAWRDTSYWLRWYENGLWCEAFLAVCGGGPILAVTRKDYDSEGVSRVVHRMTMEDLRERGMVEDFTPAAERRAACGAV